MDPSAKFYTNFFLWLYDFIVLAISNTFAWHCPTSSVLLPFYQQHLGDNAHLEIGVGTGYYPAASVARLSQVQAVTLLDLNPNTLAYSQRRLLKAGYKGDIQTVERSVFDPLPETMHGKYDSAALFYVFHCLPGSFPTKAIHVFGNIVPALAPGGVIYGSTVLGKGVPHNWLGRQLMAFYNSKGVFGNTQDTQDGLRKALEEMFEEWDLRVVGAIAIFTARTPKV
ncbi:S-adenosyl-L-methionine dependent methyltransferase [Trametes coccinea BRFM310]|uniref:S-adenosyl-L-methionine dependent methyltransferase n=1 Tax=Trametes coccinea (strain BRFM310) TaxID=1353009 RepID=A0A1Y2IEN7_TRAC3|nr:S-adenosyl-L-methionine dependent methyltransferase [Trametes coccinea BRFM310]